ncbi:MAG TPA: DNA repair protein RadA [Candidatus Cybelea sp.]|nr:DNA repair protein RadA [Candidatus Cybelea sp.]
MAKPQAAYVCQSCGASYRKWQGWCEECGSRSSIVEEAAREAVPKGLTVGKGQVIEFASLDAGADEASRLSTGIAEFDRVTGGGLVPGSAVLIGGDPGIGKSTLLLQATTGLARAGVPAVYISGEEATQQVALRARRLGLADAPVRLAAANSLRDILTTLERGPPARVVVIDSIQTMFADNLDSAPGTVAQVRATAQELVRFAKRNDATVFLVGHVTKEGQIAGPRVVEHMVDTVLYFEGERGHQFRILRAVKNRFGPTDEIGVFAMTDRGLAEVPNPSQLFLGSRSGRVSGAAVFAGMEGTRPLLVEIQALVAASPLATPRRAVVGWDSGRLAMIMAVLDARCGLALGGNDVYLNVAGGLRVNEPAADLAVAAALVSAVTDTPLPEDTVVFGEISLAGEVRAVGQADARLKEAAKLGFAHAIVPLGTGQRQQPLKLSEFDRLSALLDLFPGVERAGRK